MYIRQNTQDCIPSGSTPIRKSTINPKSNAVYGHLHSPPQRRIVLEIAIVLTKEDTFDEFAKALASLLSNAQIVNPKFVINPIN